MSFKIGDRVAKNTSNYCADPYSSSQVVPLMYHEDHELLVGEVIDVSALGKVTVRWDSKYENFGKPEILEAESLLTEEEGKARWSQLEAEFNLVADKVHEKMKQVAATIKEADDLSRTVGRPLSDMGYTIIYRTLYDAMDKAGWHTSSFGC